MSKILGKLAVLVALFGCVANAPLAQASDHISYKKVICYEKAVCYETRSVPYTKHVTRYDECGKPYLVCITCYKEVRVRVTKLVPIVNWVLVSD